MTSNTTLDYIKKHSTVVVDSGDLKLISSLQAEDATTNPTLIFQSLEKPETTPVLEKTLKYGKLLTLLLQGEDVSKFNPKEVECALSDLKHAETYITDSGKDKYVLELCIDYFMVLMGCEILKYIPGKVSTEVPPQYSFDKHASIQKAKSLIKLYEREGISSERILIKLATTWEGIKAAEELEKVGIHCNMTLLFSLVQAIAAAEAKVTLISPFVGRILDWYKKNNPTTDYNGWKDPGVKSVTEIFKYYKKHGYSTIVMAASFRNVEEILELIGCDKLTISPKLLKELDQMIALPEIKLTSKDTGGDECTQFNGNVSKSLDEGTFRFKLNEDAMATEKLSEGIRNFYKDYVALKHYLSDKLNPLP